MTKKNQKIGKNEKKKALEKTSPEDATVQKNALPKEISTSKTSSTRKKNVEEDVEVETKKQSKQPSPEPERRRGGQKQETAQTSKKTTSTRQNGFEMKKKNLLSDDLDITDLTD